MTNRRRPPAVALAVGVGFAALLAACTSGSTSSSGTTTVPGQTSLPTTSSPTTTAPTTTGPTTTVPFSQATNARQDVTTGTCEVNGAGLWSWSGTVANRTSHTHNYSIIVDFTDSAATVLQTKTVTVPDVAAGRTVPWSVTGPSGHKSGVLCVVRSARLS